MSPDIPYNEYYMNNRLDFLVMNGPTQPPLVGIAVCAYGGVSNLVCGEIAAFEVTIKTRVPGTNGKQTADFQHVVKVLMNKNYNPGDLGAPVYIPAQFLPTPQIIANPVGQVIENVDPNHEANA